MHYKIRTFATQKKCVRDFGSSSPFFLATIEMFGAICNNSEKVVIDIISLCF